MNTLYQTLKLSTYFLWKEHVTKRDKTPYVQDGFYEDLVNTISDGLIKLNINSFSQSEASMLLAYCHKHVRTTCICGQQYQGANGLMYHCHQCQGKYSFVIDNNLWNFNRVLTMLMNKTYWHLSNNDLVIRNTLLNISWFEAALVDMITKKKLK